MNDIEMTNNDNIKEIKEMWEEINKRLARLEEATLNEGRRVSENNIRSAQQNLETTYKRFSVTSFISAVLFPIVFGAPISIFDYPSHIYQVTVALSMCAYFLTAAIMDLYLFHKVRGMDLAEMPVTTIRQTAIRLKKKHHIFMMILIPMAIAMLVLMAYPIIEETWLGLIIGGVLGLAIGLRFYFKIMSDYKKLISE